MGKKGYLANRQSAYEWLKATFPKAFAVDSPLKIGIHEEAFAFEGENRPATIHLRRAIYLHVSRSIYLRRIKVGVERIDLDGNGCGQIIDEDTADAAKEKIQVLRDYYKQKKKIAGNKTQKPEPKQSVSIKDEVKAGKSSQSILTLKKKTPITIEA